MLHLTTKPSLTSSKTRSNLTWNQQTSAAEHWS